MDEAALIRRICWYRSKLSSIIHLPIKDGVSSSQCRLTNADSTKLVDSRDRSLWACRSGFSAIGFEVLSFWVWDLEHLSWGFWACRFSFWACTFRKVDLLGLGVLRLQVWNVVIAGLEFWVCSVWDFELSGGNVFLLMKLVSSALPYVLMSAHHR
jgi:hypothetical protein